MATLEDIQKVIANPQGAPSSQFGDIRGLFDSSFQVQSIQPAVGALGASTATTVSNQRAASADARNAAQQKINDRIAELQKLNDPKEYQQLRREDGGFDFKDPLGNPISVKKYAKITNKTVAEVLKESENLRDRQFLSDKESMEEILQSFIENDTAYFDRLKEDQPEFAALLEKSKPEDLVMRWKDFYSEYFEDISEQRAAQGSRAFPGFGTGDETGFTPLQSPFN